MKIESIFSQIKSNPNKFPRFYAILLGAALEIQQKWEYTAALKSGIRVKDGGLGWWGAQYLAQGQIRIRRQGLGYTIYYDQGRAAIDFAKVVEHGRSPYDIATNLLNNSKKVRISKNGKKYLIVPMGSDSSYADKALKIISSYKEPSLIGGTVKRNKYSVMRVVDKMVSKSKTTAFTQKQEGGGSSSTIKNLVILTEDNKWKKYPAIKPQKFIQKLQQEVDKLLNTESFSKELGLALAMDLKANAQAKGRKKT